MRICVIGKYPPIQGGVSMRTYWTAHGLAALGHEVHVVTNAKEVRPPFRMHMRAEDWERSDARHGGGPVTVHWTDPVDRSQAYIPMASSFVSKLAAVAATLHSASRFDLVYSHYMEPYGVAGHLLAQMTGIPHVVRLAGSDAGRLWHHPQLEALYDHVLRTAAFVIATGPVAERAIARGVRAGRIASVGGHRVPEDLFAPDGATLDFTSLRAEVEQSSPDLRDAFWGGFAGGLPYFGMYGKLGDQKGSFALLSALERLKDSGVDVGLVVLAHGRPDVERRFRDQAEALGLIDRILQIPFLPHWRVPEFLRGCLAVCCLEQNFPIGFHAPITPREVLLSGTCLVGSSEVIRKLPGWEQLPNGYGCVAVEDVNDIAALSSRLAAIARDPLLARQVGRRGRDFAVAMQARIPFPRSLERVLVAAAGRRRLPVALRYSSRPSAPEPEHDRFRLTRLITGELAKRTKPSKGVRRGRSGPGTVDLEQAQRTLLALERALERGESALRPFAHAVQVEVAVALAENEMDTAARADGIDPLFRLRVGRWALADEDLPELVPVTEAGVQLLRFDFDAAALRDVRTIADLYTIDSCNASYIVALCANCPISRGTLAIDSATARILHLSDGRHTVREVLVQVDDAPASNNESDRLDWIKELFVLGLIQLRSAEAL